MTAPLPRTAPAIWTPELTSRARGLKWLLLDVDGVLTDGRLWFDAEGESVKVFDVRDGLGIKLLTGAGIEVGILSARTSPIVEKRSRDLGLSEVLQGRENKLDTFRDFPARRGLDAVPDVRSRVHYVTGARGGRGAVRELAERLLTARGVWDAIVEHFASPREAGDS